MSMGTRMGWEEIKVVEEVDKKGSRVEITLYRWNLERNSRYCFCVRIHYGGNASHPWMGHSVWLREDPYLYDSMDEALNGAVEYVKRCVNEYFDYGEFRAAILSLLPAADPQLSLFGGNA